MAIVRNGHSFAAIVQGSFDASALKAGPQPHATPIVHGRDGLSVRADGEVLDHETEMTAGLMQRQIPRLGQLPRLGAEREKPGQPDRRRQEPGESAPRRAAGPRMSDTMAGRPNVVGPGGDVVDGLIAPHGLSSSNRGKTAACFINDNCPTVV
jgi:hypothetical protein